MVIAKQYNFPDFCPTFCPYIFDFFENNSRSTCYTCPILLCIKSSIIKPDDFPEENACAWWNFFRNNMVGNPDYYLSELRGESYN